MVEKTGTSGGKIVELEGHVGIQSSASLGSAKWPETVSMCLNVPQFMGGNLVTSRAEVSEVMENLGDLLCLFGINVQITYASLDINQQAAANRLVEKLVLIQNQIEL